MQLLNPRYILDLMSKMKKSISLLLLLISATAVFSQSQLELINSVVNHFSNEFIKDSCGVVLKNVNQPVVVDEMYLENSDFNDDYLRGELLTGYDTIIFGTTKKVNGTLVEDWDTSIVVKTIFGEITKDTFSATIDNLPNSCAKNIYLGYLFSNRLYYFMELHYEYKYCVTASYTYRINRNLEGLKIVAKDEVYDYSLEHDCSP